MPLIEIHFVQSELKGSLEIHVDRKIQVLNSVREFFPLLSRRRKMRRSNPEKMSLLLRGNEERKWRVLWGVVGGRRIPWRPTGGRCRVGSGRVRVRRRRMVGSRRIWVN